MIQDIDRIAGLARPAAARPPLDSRGASRSNFLAFVIGGLVIAVGCLAFMYHDGRQASARDLASTGSIQAERDAPGRGLSLLSAPAARP